MTDHDVAALIQRAQETIPEATVDVTDAEWAIDRVTRMAGAAYADAIVYQKKLLKGFGYPNETFSRAQDARALSIVLALLTAQPPVFWKHAIDECNSAHAALDKAGAPKTKEVMRRSGIGKQQITIGVAERIQALLTARETALPQQFSISTAGDSDNPIRALNTHGLDGEVPAALVAAPQQQGPCWDKSTGHEQGDQKAERPAVENLHAKITALEAALVTAQQERERLMESVRSSNVLLRAANAAEGIARTERDALRDQVVLMEQQVTAYQANEHDCEMKMLRGIKEAQEESSALRDQVVQSRADIVQRIREAAKQQGQNFMCCALTLDRLADALSASPEE